MDGPKVTITQVAEKLVQVPGQQQLTRAYADTVEPGEVIHYTLHLVNEGNQTASNVVVNNPIPDGAIYVPGSAGGKGSSPLLSTDGGHNFVEERYGILPESVTNLRWIIGRMPANSRRELSFQVTALDRRGFALARWWSTFYLWLVSTFSR